MKQLFIDEGIYISDAVYKRVKDASDKGLLAIGSVVDLLKTLGKTSLDDADLLYYFGLETDFWEVVKSLQYNTYDTFHKKAQAYGEEPFMEELEKAITYYELSKQFDKDVYLDQLNKVYLARCCQEMDFIDPQDLKDLSQYFLHSYFEDEEPLKSVYAIGLRGFRGRN